METSQLGKFRINRRFYPHDTRIKFPPYLHCDANNVHHKKTTYAKYERTQGWTKIEDNVPLNEWTEVGRRTEALLIFCVPEQIRADGIVYLSTMIMAPPKHTMTAQLAKEFRDQLDTVKQQDSIMWNHLCDPSCEPAPPNKQPDAPPVARGRAGLLR